MRTCESVLFYVDGIERMDFCLACGCGIRRRINGYLSKTVMIEIERRFNHYIRDNDVANALPLPVVLRCARFLRTVRRADTMQWTSARCYREYTRRVNEFRVIYSG